ncbi:hypothetical protein [Aldersonia kunmingensis]|uniref:hypothetical protein n=1 Tax=Aldersonia kunmingensis TaxID=408066 RepID=UPI00082EFA20|nr:hypothetical protein [Aldersonia kunmingensis]
MSQPLTFLPEPIRREVQAQGSQQHATDLANGRAARETGVEGAEPNYVTELEAFASFSHEEIYRHVQTMNPGTLNAAAKQWFEAASGFSGAVTGGVMAALAALDRSWEGTTAEKISDAISSLSKQASQTHDVMTSVISRLKQAGYAAEALKAAVPPPEPPVSVAETALAIISPTAAIDVKQAEERREAARQEAIRAMDSIYVTTMKPVGDAVPSFFAPTDPTSGGTGNGTGSGGGGGMGSFGSSGTSGDGGETSSATEDLASDGSSSETAAGQSASSETRATSAESGSSSMTSPANSSADGSTAASSYGSGANGSGSGSGGSGGGGFLGGSAGARRDERKREGTDGLTGLGVGALGGAMAGAVAAGGDSMRPGMSVAAAAKGGMSTGMMPGGHRGKGEDDKEHETPSYLVNADNGSELIGDLSPTAPPVIGAWGQA